VSTVLVVVVLGVVLVPRLAGLFADDSADRSKLTNTSAVTAGTPVNQLGSRRPTVGSNATAQTLATPVASAPSTPAQPVAQDGAAQARPTLASAQTAAAAAAASRPAGVTGVTNVTPPPLFDETFATNAAGWPDNSSGAAWFADGAYRLATRQAGQFVAITAPFASVPADVAVNATFHKVSGPPGGGYGIIVRRQSAPTQDGTDQGGQYYVLEVGDKGEIGVWRRDGDQWIDLLPWQHSDAVKPGTAPNELAVRAVGSSLSLLVNGTQVTTRTDDTLSAGDVGIFVGGDGNEVALEHFTVQTP
jgi:hypothetical protein